METFSEYDNWEFYTEELCGMQRISKLVSSVIKEEMNLDLFVRGYRHIYNQVIDSWYLSFYEDEYLKLAGIKKEDIKPLD